MATLEQLRKALPMLQGMSDSEAIYRLHAATGIELDELANELGQPRDEPGFVSSLQKSAIGTVGYGLGRMGEDYFGLKDNALKHASEDLMFRNPSGVNSLEDIADKPGLAVREGLGMGLGLAADMLVTRGAGALLGAAGAGTRLAGMAGAAGRALGGMPGQTLLMSAPSYGGIRDYQDQTGEESIPMATLGALAVGRIEQMAGPQQYLYKGLGRKAFEGSAKGAFARELGKNVLGEAGEELVQNPIEQYAGGLDPTQPKQIQDTLFGGAMGAIGGLVGAPGAAYAGLQQRAVNQASIRDILGETWDKQIIRTDGVQDLLNGPTERERLMGLYEQMQQRQAAQQAAQAAQRPVDVGYFQHLRQTGMASDIDLASRPMKDFPTEQIVDWYQRAKQEQQANAQLGITDYQTTRQMRHAEYELGIRSGQIPEPAVPEGVNPPPVGQPGDQWFSQPGFIPADPNAGGKYERGLAALQRRAVPGVKGRPAAPAQPVAPGVAVPAGKRAAPVAPAAPAKETPHPLSLAQIAFMRPGPNGEKGGSAKAWTKMVVEAGGQKNGNRYDPNTVDMEKFLQLLVEKAFASKNIGVAGQHAFDAAYLALTGKPLSEREHEQGQGRADAAVQTAAARAAGVAPGTDAGGRVQPQGAGQASGVSPQGKQGSLGETWKAQDQQQRIETAGMLGVLDALRNLVANEKRPQQLQLGAYDIVNKANPDLKADITATNYLLNAVRKQMVDQVEAAAEEAKAKKTKPAEAQQFNVTEDKPVAEQKAVEPKPTEPAKKQWRKAPAPAAAPAVTPYVAPASEEEELTTALNEAVAESNAEAEKEEAQVQKAAQKATLLRNLFVKAFGDNPRTAEMLVDFVSGEKQLTLSEIAGKYGITESGASHAVSRETGVSPKEIKADPTKLIGLLKNAAKKLGYNDKQLNELINTERTVEAYEDTVGAPPAVKSSWGQSLDVQERNQAGLYNVGGEKNKDKNEAAPSKTYNEEEAQDDAADDTDLHTHYYQKAMKALANKKGMSEADKEVEAQRRADAELEKHKQDQAAKDVKELKEGERLEPPAEKAPTKEATLSEEDEELGEAYWEPQEATKDLTTAYVAWKDLPAAAKLKALSFIHAWENKSLKDKPATKNPAVRFNAYQAHLMDAVVEARKEGREPEGYELRRYTDFSGAQTQTGPGSTIDEVTKLLKKLFFSPAWFDDLVTVVQSQSELPDVVVNDAVKAKYKVIRGVHRDGHVWLVADNLSGQAQILGVFLHELGVHVGMEKILGPKLYARLTAKIDEWAARDDSSIESMLAKDAVRRAGSKEKEKVAFFVQGAVEMGIDPKTVQEGSAEFRLWFRQLWAAFKATLRRLKFRNPDKLNAQDIVDMAFGAADLELSGGWHGTAAVFRKFSHTFMGTGEGRQSEGWGTYIGQAEEVGKAYHATLSAQKRTGGALMRVAVGVNNFLDLDEPYAKQTQEVKDALAKLGMADFQFPSLANGFRSGRDILKAVEFAKGGQREAAKALDKVGIGGSRFLDQNSFLGKTKTKTRNLIVYNDKNVVRVSSKIGDETVFSAKTDRLKLNGLAKYLLQVAEKEIPSDMWQQLFNKKKTPSALMEDLAAGYGEMVKSLNREAIMRVIPRDKLRKQMFHEYEVIRDGGMAAPDQREALAKFAMNPNDVEQFVFRLAQERKNALNKWTNYISAKYVNRWKIGDVIPSGRYQGYQIINAGGMPRNRKYHITPANLVDTFYARITIVDAVDLPTKVMSIDELAAQAILLRALYLRANSRTIEGIPDLDEDLVGDVWMELMTDDRTYTGFFDLYGQQALKAANKLPAYKQTEKGTWYKPGDANAIKALAHGNWCLSHSDYAGRYLDNGYSPILYVPKGQKKARLAVVLKNDGSVKEIQNENNDGTITEKDLEIIKESFGNEIDAFKPRVEEEELDNEVSEAYRSFLKQIEWTGTHMYRKWAQQVIHSFVKGNYDLHALVEFLNTSLIPEEYPRGYEAAMYNQKRAYITDDGQLGLTNTYAYDRATQAFSAKFIKGKATGEANAWPTFTPRSFSPKETAMATLLGKFEDKLSKEVKEIVYAHFNEIYDAYLNDSDRFKGVLIHNAVVLGSAYPDMNAVHRGFSTQEEQDILNSYKIRNVVVRVQAASLPENYDDWGNPKVETVTIPATDLIRDVYDKYGHYDFDYSDAGTKLDVAIDKWRDTVMWWVRGRGVRTEAPVVFNSTPGVLQAVGLPNLPVKARGRHFIEESLFNHGVKPSQLVAAARDLANPLAVYASTNERGELRGVNVVTQQKGGEGQLVVIFQPVSDAEGAPAHIAVTIYGMSPERLQREVSAGGLLYQGNTAEMPELMRKGVMEAKKEFGQTAWPLSALLAGNRTRDVARTSTVMYRADAVKLIEAGKADFSGETELMSGLKVLYSPTRAEVERMIRTSKDNAVRFFIERGKIIYAWPAYDAVHWQVANQLGISARSDENGYSIYRREGMPVYEGYAVGMDEFNAHVRRGTIKFDSETDFSGETEVVERKLPEIAMTSRAVSRVAKTWGRKALLPLLFGHDLVNYIGDTMKSARSYFKAVQDKINIRERIELQIKNIATEFNSFTADERDQANEFMMDSTMQQKWGFQPEGKDAVEIDDKMQERFNTFKPEVQAVIKSVFAMNEKLFYMLEDAVERSATKASLKFKRAKLDGPYAALMRFGDYAVIWKSNEFMDAQNRNARAEMAKMETDPAHYRVQFVESALTAERVAEKMRRELGGHVENGDLGWFAREEESKGTTEMPFQAVRRLQAAIEKGPIAGEKYSAEMQERLTKMANQLYVASLASMHARKSELHRRRVVGAEKDMMRSFVSHASAMSRLIAAVEVGDAMADSLQSMRSEAREGTLEARNRKMQVLNEVLARHGALLNAKDTPWQDGLMLMNSFYTLLTSPAYWMSNATQPFVMTLPKLVGHHGAGKAWSTFINAYSEVTDTIDFRRGTFIPENVRNTVYKESAALEEILIRGNIDITLNQDIGDLSDGVYKHVETLRNITTGLRKIPHVVEMMNRVSSGIAAYRLEFLKQRGKGANEEQAHAEAVEYANKIIEDTHGNYGAANAPRLLMQGDKTLPVKMMGQFRKFQLIQAALIIKTVNAGWLAQDVSPEERMAARKTMRWLLATYLTLGGLAGLPAGAAIMAALGMIFGDDDDKDDEVVMTRVIGDRDMARLILHGVPAALGVDVSKRLGAGQMFSLFPFADTGRDTKATFSNYMLAAMGPAVGTAARFADGVGLMKNGQYWKGLELMSPVGATNISRGIRFATEGVTSRRGDLYTSPDEVGAINGLFQAVGLPTTAVTERQWKQRAVTAYTENFHDEASRIKNDYVHGDAADRAQARKEWMELQKARVKNGFTRQPLSELLKAPQETKKRVKKFREGVPTTKENARFLATM